MFSKSSFSFSLIMRQTNKIKELEQQNKRYREWLEYMLERTREAMKEYGDRYGEGYNFERYDECSFYEDMIEQALEEDLN